MAKHLCMKCGFGFICCEYHFALPQLSARSALINLKKSGLNFCAMVQFNDKNPIIADEVQLYSHCSFSLLCAVQINAN